MEVASPGIVRTWVNTPPADFVLALTVGILGFSVRMAGLHPLAHFRAPDRLIWLQTAAGASVAVLGLAVTATTIFYAVTPGPRLQTAMSKVGPSLTQLLVSSLWAIAAASAVFVVLMPLYTRDSVTVVSLVVLVALVVLVLRTARLLWLFSRLLYAFAAEAREEAVSDLQGDWEAPEIGPDDYAIPQRRWSRRRSSTS